jgi:biopolymer transport protein ExbD
MRKARIEIWRKRVAPVVYFDSQRISWEQLGPLLDGGLALRPPDWPVYVQGDDVLEWQTVVQAIDIVRGKGAQVVLLTTKAR